MHNPITQQQAEQLIATATPGPWYLHEDDWSGTMIVNDAGRDMTWDDQLRVIIEAGHSEKDGKLLTSAPDLARTVIWLWEQNQQQQDQIERLQAYARILENSFDETAFIRDNTHLNPGDME